MDDIKIYLWSSSKPRLTGNKTGEYGYTKIGISQEQKELFSWNKKNSS